MTTIILPLSVMIPRKTREDKQFTMNLNIYRNAHHHLLDDAKKEMKEHVRLAAEGLQIGNPPYQFVYTIYPGNGRAFDLGNVCPIIQKFTDDALIELGHIKDDSFKIIPEIRYIFGAIDKENPRAELRIISL